MQYNLPPWLGQPADPAAHYTTGVQIGVRIGAEQAAQQYQQQQIARAMQQDEFERQYKTAVMNLKVEDAVRKQRAIADYQNRVASGTDPLRALMEVGPGMGESVAGAARAQTMAESVAQRQAEAEATLGLRQQQFETREARMEREAKLREDREKRMIQSEERRAREVVARQKLAIGRDEELKNLKSVLDSSKAQLAEMQRTGKSMLTRQATWDEKLQSLADEVTQTEKAIADRMRELGAEIKEAPLTGTDDDALPTVDTGAEPLPEPASTIKRLRWDNGRLVPVQ